MGYGIVEISDLSGPGCKIYSVVRDGEEGTLLDEFIERMDAQGYSECVNEILLALTSFGREFGAREQFFRLNEGKPGDGVVALLKKKRFQIRLYGIRFGNVLLILGSGGVKPPGIASWQQDPVLKEHAEEMITLSRQIQERIINKEIFISPQGELSGNLRFDQE